MNDSAEAAAAVTAANDVWFCELVASLRELGLGDTLIDYPSLMDLTTFGPEHTSGDHPCYGLHEDEKGTEVEISAGDVLPLGFPGYTKEEAATAAEFRKSAYIKLPAPAERVACWIYGQTGDVEFAVKGEPGVTVKQWVDAIAGLAGRALLTSAPALPWQRQRARMPGHLIDLALKGMGCAASATSAHAVMDHLRSLGTDMARAHGLSIDDDGKLRYRHEEGNRRELTLKMVSNALAYRAKKLAQALGKAG